MKYTILPGDCKKSMRTLPEKSVHCCVTSPPYYGLRDYGHEGQIGLEETPEQYVAKIVDVFREVRRVLRDDGTVWLNLGDSYASVKSGYSSSAQTISKKERGEPTQRNKPDLYGNKMGIKDKDLLGIPWRVAFALQADGWYLRQDIIWHKPNQMPESVTDRCTKAHEYIFLLTKSARYWYDNEAIKEAAKQDWGTRDRTNGKYHKDGTGLTPHSGLEKSYEAVNRRSVWTVATQPYKGAHFATFPPDLIRPCVLAGCPAGGIVIDPFGGSGTTGQVAIEEGRNTILCELNPAYIELMERRLAGTQMPLF